jgi:hypothetical protein
MSGITRDVVLKALWEWDPIGVAAHRTEASSEYDDLARRIVVGVDQGSSYGELETIVRRYVEDLGVRPIGRQDQFLRWLKAVIADTR